MDVTIIGGFVSGLVLILVAKIKLSSDKGPNWQAYAERQAADLDTVNQDMKEVRGELKSLRTEVGSLRSELGTVKSKLFAAVHHIRAWRQVVPDPELWPPLPAELHEDLDQPTN